MCILILKTESILKQVTEMNNVDLILGSLHHVNMGIIAVVDKLCLCNHSESGNDTRMPPCTTI
jgi:hypothetical protein